MSSTTNLPKINLPSYFLTIPSTKKEIKYRPFIVKEEKMLMMALQESDPRVLIETIKDMLTSCTMGDIDISSLTSYDIEFILLNVRIKSKGHEVEMQYVCKNIVTRDDGTTGECGTVSSLIADLNKAKLEGDLIREKVIMIQDDIGIMLKVPTFDDMHTINTMIDSADKATKKKVLIYDIIPMFVDYIFQGDTKFDSIENDELVEWIDQLDESRFTEINDFFSKIPKLKLKIDLCCAVCKHEEIITLEGLQSFLQ